MSFSQPYIIFLIFSFHFCHNFSHAFWSRKIRTVQFSNQFFAQNWCSASRELSGLGNSKMGKGGLFGCSVSFWLHGTVLVLRALEIPLSGSRVIDRAALRGTIRGGPWVWWILPRLWRTSWERSPIWKKCQFIDYNQFKIIL